MRNRLRRPLVSKFTLLLLDKELFIASKQRVHLFFCENPRKTSIDCVRAKSKEGFFDKLLILKLFPETKTAQYRIFNYCYEKEKIIVAKTWLKPRLS